jgi:hypothetical protein
VEPDVSAATLAEVRAAAVGDESYPIGLLERCDTALMLFAAGFHGRQDAIFAADAGLVATCVDVDRKRLQEMAAIYPGSWEFVVADAFEFASESAGSWDLVSVDCPSGAFDVCAELAPRWCSLARVAVVIGTGRKTIVAEPYGWQVTDVRRRSDFAGGVYWTVLEPR